MYFQHSDDIWRTFPQLVAGVLLVEGITSEASVEAPVAELSAVAASRLATMPEGEFPEVQAWRRAFSRMGLKPTQYRSASESLLRRYRKEGSLPHLHPLVDLCNAASLAFAIPVAAFDVARITGPLEVRHAVGDESYQTFTGDVEHPDPGEVIFVDDEGRSHARRWTNRQSGASAVQGSTTDVLIVTEALHDTASNDVRALRTTLATEIGAAWSTTPMSALLSHSAPRFTFGPAGQQRI